jgi:magnesium-protoporphyrin IX monomethyl ester (oxidative) cyclase
VVLDVENPEFVRRLQKCVANNAKLREIARGSGPFKGLRKLPLYLDNFYQFLRLFLLKPRKAGFYLWEQPEPRFEGTAVSA